MKNENNKQKALRAKVERTEKKAIKKNTNITSSHTEFYCISETKISGKGRWYITKNGRYIISRKRGRCKLVPSNGPTMSRKTRSGGPKTKTPKEF